jgi:hypothetical protein
MRILAVLAAVAVTVPIAPAVARAEPASLTWTVQPATASGPDGRRWIERTLDPGQAATEYLAVRNFSDAGAVFALKAADGYLTDKGRFNMLPSDRKSVDGGTWIAVQPTVSVPAKGTKVVPFRITVPRAATPGDHPAGIAASVLSASGTVRVESRVGFRVLLRAGGTARPALTATHLTAHYSPSWNPFRSGTVQLSYNTTNSGNVRLDARGRMAVSSLFGAHARARDFNGGELMPGAGRPESATLGGVWPLGRLATTVKLTPAGGTPVTVTTSTWALPWSHLILLAVVVALLLLWRRAARRRRRNLNQMLEEARLEGRREATA